MSTVAGGGVSSGGGGGGGGGGGDATLPIDLTTGVSGALPAANGGTGATSLPAGGLAGLTALASGDAASVSTAAADATSKANAAQAASQPLDSDLTAIAALSTTSFGRSLLALADASAGRTALALGTAATHATGDYDAAGAAAAAQSASQPLDSDLTAIAALSTTSYGRALLELADAAAGRTALGLGTAATSASSAFEVAGAAAAAQAASQPLDSDLTAIAALSTTSFGRSFLPLADAAAGRTLLGLGTAATAASSAFDAAGAAAAAQSASQPLDSDLTAIAALSTTSFGRSFLALADAAAAKTLIGAISLTADVSGVLPKANQGAQDMGGDCSGSTASCTVAKVNGITCTGTPAAGNTLIASSSSAAAWGSVGAAGATVWTADSSQASSTFSTSNVRYVPLSHSASNTVEFQFVAPYTGTLQLSFMYAMSSSSGNNVRLRLDVLQLATGDAPTTALSTGTAFTVTPGSDVNMHKVSSSDSADLAVSITAGKICKFLFTRLGSDGADTHTGDMRIIDVRAA